MTFVYAFLCCGIFCFLGQLLYEYTKLTPGHITSIFVILGVFLDSFHIYDWLISYAQAGALLPITSFGHSLVHASLMKANEIGILGVFTGIFDRVASGLALTIVLGVFFAFIFRPKS